MNIRLHKSLLAGAIAAVLATPVWSAGTHEEGSEKSGASSERYESEYQRSQGAASTGTKEHQGLSGVGAGTTGASGSSGTSGTSGMSGSAGTSGSSGMSGTSGSSSLSSSAGASAGAQSELQQKTPNDLEGMKVVGANNEQIGEIEKVVRSRQDDTIFAVISFGGMLGMGESKVLVPLDELQQGQEGDQQLQISKSKDELKTAERYDEEQYADLEPKDRPISEFARFETRPQGELGERESGVTEQRIQREKPGDIESRQGQQGSQGIGTSPGGVTEE